MQCFSSQHRDRHCCSNSLFPQSPHLRRDSVVVDTGENWILLIVTQQLCPGVYCSFLDDACWPPDKRQRIVALRDTSTSCSLMMATSSSTVTKEEGHPARTQVFKGWHLGCNITSKIFPSFKRSARMQFVLVFYCTPQGDRAEHVFF